MSIARRRYLADDANRERHRAACRRYWELPGVREQQVEQARRQMADPAVREHRRQLRINFYSDPAKREAQREAKRRFMKPVVQLTRDGESIAVHPSLHAAARATGIDRADIGRCCCVPNKLPTAGGFVWKYGEAA